MKSSLAPLSAPRAARRKTAAPQSHRVVLPLRALGFIHPEPLPRLGPGLRALTTRDRRLAVLQEISGLLGQGLNRTEACRELQIAWTTYWRWRTAFERGGVDGLLPRRSPGRPSALRPLLSSRVLAAVARIALLKGSTAAAWRDFARSQVCPAPIARAIRGRKTLPALLTRAVRIRRVPCVALIGPNHFAVWLKTR